MSPSKTQPITIIAIPFPGQSHLNQLLHFSLILSTRNLPIHFAAPPSSIHQAQLRLHGWPSSSLLNIHFHSLPLPPPPPLPSSHLSHALRLFDTPLLLRPSLAPLLLSLSRSSHRLIVLHDTFMSLAALDAAASLPNAEFYTFQCVSAFQALFELNRARAPAHPLVAAEFEDWVPRAILERVERLECGRSLDNAGIVANSCRPLDGEFVDMLEKECGSRRVFAVSPLHLVGPRLAVGLGERDDECFVWLDKQPVASVVYVSFGSTTTMGAEQVEQLAIGLRRSGQRFIWVIREADKGAISTEADSETGGLPTGFEDEMQGLGMVIRGWAPQVEILAHQSTGAFMSHCGWNSTMESLSSGVPIIAWPMQLDQPRNAMLLAEYLKAGVIVREWERRKAVVSAARVEEVVRMMVVEEEGRGMRERAKEIGEEIRRAVAEGGSSMADLNAFVAHITREG